MIRIVLTPLDSNEDSGGTNKEDIIVILYVFIIIFDFCNKLYITMSLASL